MQRLQPPPRAQPAPVRTTLPLVGSWSLTRYPEGGSGFLDNILKPMVSLTTPVAESSAEPVVPTAISTEAVAPASAPVTPTRASRSRGARGRGALGSRALNGAASPAQSGAASPSLVDCTKRG
mgnify:FL=1